MHLFRTIGLCLVLATLCGCQDDPSQRGIRLYGHLFVDDQLAANANIAFHPVDPEKSNGRCPVATTQQDRSFELTTYSMCDGAPAGDYAVTVTWPDGTIQDDECECSDLLLHDCQWALKTSQSEALQNQPF